MNYSQTNGSLRLSLEPVSPDLFSDQAQAAAQACSSKMCNKPAQIRRFYDELVMWHDKIFAAKTPEAQMAKFNELLPFIQMICAKAAYAKGRKLIDDAFKNLIDNLIKQITTPARLKTAKLFFEAFLGYMKDLETMK